MLVMEALQWANDKLKGIADSSMLDGELLLAAALSVSKSWLFTHLDHEMKAHEEARFQEFVKRRSEHEPVAYIVGWKEFYKRRFTVNRFTLIPRPATETLVEHAIAAAATNHSPQPTHDVLFADIGTGSGAIAITLAAETKLPVIAVDMSKQALAVASQNAEQLGVTDLVDFKHGNLIEPVIRIFKAVGVTHEAPYHHLVLCANLPYLSEHQMETAQLDVRDFEPHEALVAGRDGLDAYFELFKLLKRHRSALPERVTVLIEIDPSQRQSAPDLIAHDFPHARPTVAKDLDGFDRIVTVEL